MQWTQGGLNWVTSLASPTSNGGRASHQQPKEFRRKRKGLQALGTFNKGGNMHEERSGGVGGQQEGDTHLTPTSRHLMPCSNLSILLGINPPGPQAATPFYSAHPCASELEAASVRLNSSSQLSASSSQEKVVAPTPGPQVLVPTQGPCRQLWSVKKTFVF